MNPKDDWRTEYRYKPHMELNSDTAEITIHNFRSFQFSDENKYIWNTKSYNLSDLRSVDLVQSHWTGKVIAHVFLSFGFANGEYVSFSIETRRKSHQEFSVWKGFFYHYDIIYVVADEQDLIGTRVNLRNEQVYIYPLNLDHELVTLLFLNYMHKVNELKDTDERYHSMWNNCTTSIYKIAKKTYPEFKFNWKLLASGYAFKYCIQLGFIEKEQFINKQQIPIIELIDNEFSKKIRN
ncbi:DUF4105 domain-containing protein [Providencia rustigianii]|uniref:Lnb N-terminal periplasmic domain-containing protein n=1 Tax=Providencia rustigianii TaxID=158850 RepID=UPI000D917602|nr:DUF4105 domain-containing protein [Providencia rustigianii]SPY76261.1 Uncharacterised protein [Providencia rustigianii]